MSKHETWRTRQYWRSIGGLLIEEFTAISANKHQEVGKRLIDGIIVPKEADAIQAGGHHDFTGKDIIVVQTKPKQTGWACI